MKVVFIANAAAVHTQRWANAIRPHVDDLLVLSERPGKIDGCRVVNLQLVNSRGNKFRTLFYKIRYLFRAWWLLVQEKPDIIHVHYLRADSSILAYLFFPRVIISVWGSDVTRDSGFISLVRFYRRMALSRAAVVTATTQFLAQRTRPYLSTDKPIHVIPFGVSLDHFRSSRGSQRTAAVPMRIGYVKHLRDIYGPDILLKAVSRLRNAATVEIVGDGPLYDSLVKLCADLGLHNVTFHGFIPQERLPHFLNSIDLFVMPTRVPEAFGVAAVEAQAMGIPVVASRIGGIGEAVSDGETGILVTPDDPDALAEAIDRLIEDPALYFRLSRRCRDWVTDKFDWNGNVQQMVDLYRELAP